ncbi:hypothetical protein LXA43DRAFT_973790 [Ganoderma leucocontextum]|nr:hypothetical protein LXA43DRAFT_973790 [Ganoderma leucocontextum]
MPSDDSKHVASDRLTSRPRSRLWDGEDGEVSLETCDGVLFTACAVLFRLASPVLAAQLSNSTSSSSSSSSSCPRRIHVPETSTVISLLLKVYHPSDEPPPTDLLGTYHALMAAEKYRMQKALRHLRSALLSLQDDPSTDPIMLYGVACRCGMRDLAAGAAKRTLRGEPEPAAVMYARLDGLGIESAGCLHRLLVYQRKSREAARSVVEGTWRTRLESSCRLGRWAKDGGTPCWYERYMNAVAMQAWPSAASVTGPDLLRGVISSCPKKKGRRGGKRETCGYCSNPEKVLMFYNFARYVGDTIEALVEEVVLAWPDST